MKTVAVELGARRYEVVIEAGLLARAHRWLEPLARGRTVPIVTDSNLEPYVNILQQSLDSIGIRSAVMTIPAGEQSKSWSTLEQLADWLLGIGIERGDHVVALGGGVIGDLTGFACAIVKRGCQFVQIPTTLLAQVDSSVGGKTAINSRVGKNLIGAFHQPALVLIDPNTLDTLPDREVRAGYAEVVKYGLIDDADFFGWCEINGEKLLAGNEEARVVAIAHCIAAKARIVVEDEHELTGRRALLNLGHTFGHALEAEAGFSDRLLHGEAVSAGLALAYRFSAQTARCPAADAEQVTGHLARLGLPHGLASAGIAATGAALVDLMRHDKKMSGGTLPFILARGIGQSYLDDSVELCDVAAFLDGEVR